jgi:hypothetical protein
VGKLGRDWKLSLLTVGARTLFASASRARAQDHGKSLARPCDPARKVSRSVTSLRQVGRQLKGNARRRSARPRAARLTDERVRWKFLEPISATGVMARETQERAHTITHPAAMAAWGVGLTPAQERRGPRLQSGNACIETTRSPRPRATSLGVLLTPFRVPASRTAAWALTRSPSRRHHSRSCSCAVDTPA